MSISREFWSNAGGRLLAAHEPPDRGDSVLLKTIANDIAKQFTNSDDYPAIAAWSLDAIANGDINSAVSLIELLFPGWGYQFGRPLTARGPCGWYATVFRERQQNDPEGLLAGMWPQDGRRRGSVTSQYANGPALALMAALCYALADNEPGSSALAA